MAIVRVYPVLSVASGSTQSGRKWWFLSTGLMKSLQWSNQDQNRSGVCPMVSSTDYSIEVLLDDAIVSRCGLPSRHGRHVFVLPTAWFEIDRRVWSTLDLTLFNRAYGYDVPVLVQILRVHTTTLHKLVCRVP
jgi:hypothetical protein